MTDAIVVGTGYALVGAVMLSVPIMAAALHALLRPEDDSIRRERELVRRTLEEELYGGERCLDCRTLIEPHWLRCPRCTAELRTRCRCGATLKLHWNACPWCGAAVDEPEQAVRRAA